MTWEEPQQIAFEKLKDMLGSAPVLRLLDFNKPFIMQADASDPGIGAVLLQEHPDGLFKVLYASKKLFSRARNYSMIETECLALVFADASSRSSCTGRNLYYRPPALVVHPALQDR